MVKWYDRIGNTIEMYVNGEWIKGTVINGPRTGDGTINMETADGKKYWCGVCSGFYIKTSDSLGDLITQADKIRNMTDEELAECFATLVICEICEYCGENKCNRTGDEFLCTTATSAKMLCKWLKSEAKE